MPRAARVVEADGIYHVLNRGNGRMTLFHKPPDFDAFVKVLLGGNQRGHLPFLDAWLIREWRQLRGNCETDG